MPETLVVVGGGRMGEALVSGMIGSRATDGATLVVVEASAARRSELESSHPQVQVRASVVPADAAVVAVKPGDVERACSQVASAGIRRVMSVAAGVPLSRLEAWLPGAAVLRAMPNTAAVVGAAASALSAGAGAGAGDVAWARSVLESVGTVAEVPESLLDAVTGLSGSGPAYLFLVAEAMIDAGVLVGLGRPLARQLVVQTMLGSARLLAETGRPAEQLRAEVTSPAGTTAAGLRALESAGVRAAMLDAVSASTERARALGS